MSNIHGFSVGMGIHEEGQRCLVMTLHPTGSRITIYGEDTARLLVDQILMVTNTIWPIEREENERLA